jgi:hypothetical protein
VHLVEMQCKKTISLSSLIFELLLFVYVYTLNFVRDVTLKCDKHDQQGKATFNERNPATRTSGKNRTGQKAEQGQANY